MYSRLFLFNRKLCTTHFRWCLHTIPICLISIFHLATEEGRNRTETPLICSSLGRKSETQKAIQSFFFSLYEDFDLWLPVRSPSEANNSKEIVLGHFFDWYLFRVSKWTLPANLFPCGAIGLTLHYEKKRTIMRTINYNDKKNLLNLVEKKDASKM